MRNVSFKAGKRRSAKRRAQNDKYRNQTISSGVGAFTGVGAGVALDKLGFKSSPAKLASGVIGMGAGVATFKQMEKATPSIKQLEKEKVRLEKQLHNKLKPPGMDIPTKGFKEIKGVIDKGYAKVHGEGRFHKYKKKGDVHFDIHDPSQGFTSMVKHIKEDYVPYEKMKKEIKKVDNKIKKLKN